MPQNSTTQKMPVTKALTALAMNQSKYKEKCKNAVYFLSCYLHADCMDEHQSPENLITSFIATEKLNTVISVADDFSYILEKKLNEEELESLFIELGAHYFLWNTEDLSPSKWLFKLTNQFYEKAYS